MSAARARDDNSHDDRDRNLTDAALEAEIELVSELVLAATSSNGPLRQDELDRLLGVKVNKGNKGTVSQGAVKGEDPVAEAGV